ncbi:MAG: hypothetical protein KM312_04790 [Hydrogenibacillus schlegelii]|uniref:Uncharacterized protein n=1 Tax=Hydrogenibacillus schlegelii TaxID=1484 RepID=A0A947CVQ0_HYDSH|nr:hypothetical protein [Hydrogenibacillus schlegelii]
MRITHWGWGSTVGQYVCRSCGRVVGHFASHKVIVRYVRPDGFCSVCGVEKAAGRPAAVRLVER